MFRSLYFSQSEILEAIEKLHCPEGYQCDLTFGNGCFWKQRSIPRLCFDIQPLSTRVIKASSSNLPIDTSSLDNCVFDPPFITYIKKGREHKEGKVVMSKRFGGYYTFQELETHYTDTIKEAFRVLRPKGKLIFKCQDIIHNHKMHCTHSMVIRWAEDTGFRLCDLFVLGAKHRMAGPQKGVQRHARIWHSYFLVFERNCLMFDPMSDPMF